MFLHVSWAHKMDVGGGDSCMRWLVEKKKQKIKIKKIKKTYLGPKHHIKMMRMGWVRCGGEARCHVLVAS